MTHTYEVERPRLSTWIKHLSIGLDDSCPIEAWPHHWLHTSTARAAIHSVLTWYRQHGVLKDKNSLVLVPPWLCTSLLQSMKSLCTPTVQLDSQIRVAVIYHQYGFPQNMDAVNEYARDHDIKIIEDCANHLVGSYRGQPLGTFGDAAVFSYSKLFPCVLGAALSTPHQDLYELASRRREDLHRSWISGLALITKAVTDRQREAAGDFWNQAYRLSTSVVEHDQFPSATSIKIVREAMSADALEKRRSNYLWLLKALSDRPYFAGLETEGVVPYVAPLFAPRERLERIVAALGDAGFSSGIYHFDVERNCFKPRFAPCAWIPIHQGLSEEQLDRIVKIIRAADPL